MTEHELILLSDMSKGTTIRASSILQKKTKLFGPKNVLDIENTSSSWNSEGQTTNDSDDKNNNDDDDNDQKPIHQYLTLDFGRLVQPKQIRLQFQAGFGCESCQIEYTPCNDNRVGADSDQVMDASAVILLETKDVHNIQTFDLKYNHDDKFCKKMKLVFSDFADFYGRIIVYRIEIWGREFSS